jgi:hypothetical protein
LPFPSSSVAVPALNNFQFSFLGLTFGAGTAFEVSKVEGLDQPDVRSGDAGRPRDHGLFIGLDVMGGRTITFTGQLGPVAGSTFVQSWTALAGATVPGGTTEQPLFLNLPNFGTLACMARVRRRSMPIDYKAAQQLLQDVVLQFQCSDPRLYSTPTLTSSVSPPGTSSGFAFPLAFPVSFGGGSVAGSLSVSNVGDIELRPTLTVTGPCTNPSITLASAVSSPNLTFNLTMNSGDQLVVDTDMHTATFFTSGSSIGSTRLYALAQGSTWWTLPPGTSTVQFLTGDSVATGTLTVTAPGAAYIL